ncbi:MAG: alpha/beta hydrolase [Gammaproteobacteria bacterium]
MTYNSHLQNRLSRRTLLTFALILTALISTEGSYAQHQHADKMKRQEGQQQYAQLGKCKLENGQTIESCRLGYRTYGTLNKNKTNGVLIPTWFTGDSKSHAFLADKNLIDPEKYFIVVVDAFGNGVSSSPSNSDGQPGESFPRFTIGDLVESQHRLLETEFGIHSLHAVVGISMGGMQAFEWAVRYPGFATKTVSAIGSPRLAAFNIALWETRNRILALYRDCECVNATAALSGFGYLLMVPEKVEELAPRENVSESLHELGKAQFTNLSSLQTWDQQRQAEAMITHNIAEGLRNDMNSAAAITESEFLIVVSADDRVVTPAPALAFAELVGAQIEIMDHDCGHGDLTCAPNKFAGFVQSFLNK